MSNEQKIELEPIVVDVEDCDGTCEDCDCELKTIAAPVVEAKPEPVKAKPAAAKKKDTYTVVDGDTFASIAAAFKPDGMTKHAYAVHLAATNGTLHPGTEVKL
jgi:hypothetical protein